MRSLRQLAVIVAAVTLALAATACGDDAEVTAVAESDPRAADESPLDGDDTLDDDDDVVDPDRPFDDDLPDIDLPGSSSGGDDDAGGTRLRDEDGGSAADELPIATLEIAITHPERPGVAYELSCLGDTATFFGEPAGLEPFSACARLGDPEVRARLIDGADPGRVCTEQYGGPDVARFTGVLDGNDVDTAIDRTNGCGITEWDAVLAALLPEAVGPVG